MKALAGATALLLLILALLPLPTGAASEGPVKHVLLIDGSGSMEREQDSGLLYSSGQIQALVQNLVAVDGAFAADDQISVGVFSKADPDRGLNSPVWVYHGSVGALRGHWPELKPLLGWTDLVGSLDAAVAEVNGFKGSQLVWMLTDNIDERSSDGESTDQFYEKLAGRPEMARIYVFPVDLGARQGLVLYGMTRDRGAAQREADFARLDRAVSAINASALKPELGDGGFLVRPLSDAGLDLTVTDFTGRENSGHQITFRRDSGGITLSGFQEAEPVQGRFRVELTSRFPTLAIVNAHVRAELIGVGSDDFSLPPSISQEITPTRVTLAPGQKALYTVDLNIPPPTMAWNPFTGLAGALADAGTIHGSLRLTVTDVTFAATEPDKFFKVQHIPAILGNRSHTVLSAATPLTLTVALPPWRIIVLAVEAFLLLLSVGLLLWAAFGQRRRVRVRGTHLDVTGLVSLRHRLPVPGFGFLRGRPFGGLIFVPEGHKGEKARPLRGQHGEVRLKTGSSFDYTLLTGKVRRGGSNRARVGGLY